MARKPNDLLDTLLARHTPHVMDQIDVAVEEDGTSATLYGYSRRREYVAIVHQAKPITDEQAAAWRKQPPEGIDWRKVP